MHIQNDTIAGTIGGTLLAITPHVATSEITRTIVLGALGAVVSFFFTQFSKWVWERLKRRNKRKSDLKK